MDEVHSNISCVPHVDPVHTYNKENLRLVDADLVVIEESRNMQSENENQTVMQDDGLEVFSCQSLDHIIELVSTMRKDMLLHGNSPHMIEFALTDSCRVHLDDPHSEVSYRDFLFAWEVCYSIQ